MPHYCCVGNCRSICSSGNKIQFFRFPHIWRRERNSNLKSLSEERFNLWVRAIKPNNPKLNPKSARICSKHFINGKCARLKDHLNPDWVPSLHLGNDNQPIFNVEIEIDEDPIEMRGSDQSEEEFLDDYINEIGFSQTENTCSSPHKPVPIKEDESKEKQNKIISCCVPNCKNIKSRNQPSVKFFRFPNSRENSNGKFYRTERQTAWINAIKRIDITHLNAPYKIICTEHFQTGAPANDDTHPDWVPNQKLPVTLTKAVKKSSKTSHRNASRWELLGPLAEEEIQMVCDDVEKEEISEKNCYLERELQDYKTENQFLSRQIKAKDLIISSQEEEIRILNETNKLLMQEKEKTAEKWEKTNLKMSLSREGFIDDDKKVNYFTGLPNLAVLDIIFDFVKDELVGSLMKRVNKFDALILVLMKLRLDLPMAYLGYRFGIAGNTAAHIFHTNLKVLSEKIGSLIRWPEREALRDSTSVYFKRVLGNKFTCLIDFIEDPGPAVSQEFLAHKKYKKQKYLVAISPAGAIIFVSKGFDSNLSLKAITESCGVLDFTEDGDIILSDHGKVSHQVVSYSGAKVLVQSKNGVEIDFFDSLLQNTTKSTTKETAEKDNSRTYIQRSLSVLKTKYFALINKQNHGIHKSYKNKNETDSYFDLVVRVCCGLTNISPAITSLEIQQS